MTTTNDPHDPAYLDEADTRLELARVFDVCTGCRQCVDLCGVFPSLFAALDADGGRTADALTPSDQDDLVDRCLHCNLCSTDCPFTPERAPEVAVDVPRTMVRAEAMRTARTAAAGQPRRHRSLLGRSERVGSFGRVGAAVANGIGGAPPGSLRRRLLERTSGISAQRLLPSFAPHRFSAWFRERLKVTVERPQAAVAIYPACLVEYHDTAIGHALVKVYERNGVDCELSGAGCCGAPWLHSGHLDRFLHAAERNVEVLAAEIRGGKDVIVPQPTCLQVVRDEYPVYVRGSLADLVAEHTYDAAEYLMVLHDGDDTSLDLNFVAPMQRITYHAPCHLRASGERSRSRDLLRLLGADVDVVAQCSGTDGSWGLLATNADVALEQAVSLGARIEQAPSDVVVGDCHMANTAITEQTGRPTIHPMQLLARAYGIPPEP